MSRKQPTKSKSKSNRSAPVSGFEHLISKSGFSEYRLKGNGLRVVHKKLSGTGVISTNLTYRVGARDETRGETGLAHMLEHMLFKPTEFDLKRGIDSGAMHFERETGCVLNANTWKDRTTYYFSYPKKHFTRALKIEAERMNGVVLTDKEFQPERSNVLSEFDMYFGRPDFALWVAMLGTALQSSAYGHETLGYREDIEDMTVEKLERFYRNYYRPDNAVMSVVGDVEVEEALKEIKRSFGNIKNPEGEVPRLVAREPVQEGKREVVVKRKSSQNILGFGFFIEAFPSQSWYQMAAALDVLTDGPDSVLHRALVDTGKAVSVEGALEFTSGKNLVGLFIHLSEGMSHGTIEQEVYRVLAGVTVKEIKPLLEKNLALAITNEEVSRTSSLKIVDDLTEHIAAGDWTTYLEVTKRLKALNPQAVLNTLQESFKEEKLTVGKFIGV